MRIARKYRAVKFEFLQEALIKKIVKYMQVMKDTKLVIVSDTQSIGRADDRLFKSRAKKIVDLLVKQFRINTKN
jgi:hypothetical protein